MHAAFFKRSLPAMRFTLLALFSFAALAAQAADEVKSKAGEIKKVDADKAASALPLTKVVMFSSGVGFFEHDGDVTGDTHVDLRFNMPRYQRPVEEHGSPGFRGRQDLHH